MVVGGSVVTVVVVDGNIVVTVDGGPVVGGTVVGGTVVGGKQGTVVGGTDVVSVVEVEGIVVDGNGCEADISSTTIVVLGGGGGGSVVVVVGGSVVVGLVVVGLVVVGLDVVGNCDVVVVDGGTVVTGGQGSVVVGVVVVDVVGGHGTVVGGVASVVVGSVESVVDGNGCEATIRATSIVSVVGGTSVVVVEDGNDVVGNGAVVTGVHPSPVGSTRPQDPSREHTHQNEKRPPHGNPQSSARIAAANLRSKDPLGPSTAGRTPASPDTSTG